MDPQSIQFIHIKTLYFDNIDLNFQDFFLIFPKCELPKLIRRYNIGPISAASNRLLLLGQCRRLHRSSAGPTTVAFVDCLNLTTFSRNLAQYCPVAVPKGIFGGQSMGQNWPPSEYRTYHSSNGTILAIDLQQHFCRCWANVGPYLTSHLGYCLSTQNIYTYNKILSTN